MKSRFSWLRSRGDVVKRLVLVSLGGMAAAQALTVGLLQVVSVIRRRQRQGQVECTFRAEPVLVGGNELELYERGQQLFDSMLAAIDQARESVYLETFIWKDDEVGRAFKEHLIAKAEAGVEVNVVYDRFGNLVVPAEFKRFPSVVDVLEYRAMEKPWHPIDPRHYALDHRKLLVVDGSTAFIGGYNLGSVYATKWRDTHLRIKGPLAADLAQDFAGFWNSRAPQGRQITRRYRRHFDPLVHIRSNNAAQLAFPIRDMYIAAIEMAEERIRLTNAYFAPDHGLIEALLKACKRGVEVEILVPGISNHVVVDWLSRGYFTELLGQGVRVFTYRNMLHAKTCTIDGQWSTVGTANLDRLSSVGNYEINVEIYSEGFAAQMDALFEDDLKFSDELNWREWQRRGWPAKLGERILAPLRALL